MLGVRHGKSTPARIVQKFTLLFCRYRACSSHTFWIASGDNHWPAINEEFAGMVGRLCGAGSAPASHSSSAPAHDAKSQPIKSSSDVVSGTSWQRGSATA